MRKSMCFSFGVVFVLGGVFFGCADSTSESTEVSPLGNDGQPRIAPPTGLNDASKDGTRSSTAGKEGEESPLGDIVEEEFQDSEGEEGAEGETPSFDTDSPSDTPVEPVEPDAEEPEEDVTPGAEDTLDPGAEDGLDGEMDGEMDGEDSSSTGPPPVRFISFGDQGEGNEAQYAVGAAAVTVCAARGCEFALLLGDNFYDSGVFSADDPQFETKFEIPYADLDMPFYVVLGNHDYGDLSFEWYRGEFQKEYSNINPKWVFPKEYYTFTPEGGLSDFFAFDTARLMWDNMVDEQREFLNDAIGSSDALWKVAFAHHPYLSNGAHGNAGSYEGFSFIPILSGENIKDFMDEVICGKVDLYLCGHDHNRQSFSADASSCGVNFIVNGASAKSSDFEYHDDNPTLWGDDQKPGFVWIEIDGSVLTAAWYDMDGNLDFEYTIEK